MILDDVQGFTAVDNLAFLLDKLTFLGQALSKFIVQSAKIFTIHDQNTKAVSFFKFTKRQ